PATFVHVGRVPDALAHVPALGARGRRWRTTYGELRAQADKAARLLVEVAAEERAGSVVPVVVEVGDEEMLKLLDGTRDAAIGVAGLAPQVSRGLASGADLAAGLGALVPAGVAQI